MKKDVDKQPVIVVWDKDGKFFQTWTSDYNDGAGIQHGINVANQIGGYYHILALQGNKLMDFIFPRTIDRDGTKTHDADLLPEKDL